MKNVNYENGIRPHIKYSLGTVLLMELEALRFFKRDEIKLAYFLSSPIILV